MESDGRGKSHVVTMNTCVRLPALLMMDFDDVTHMQSKDLFSRETCDTSSCELSASVLIHRLGLGSLRKTVDRDGDARATEHPFQNL